MSDKKEKPPKTKNKLSFKSKLLMLVLFAAAVYFLRQGVMLLLVGMIPACVAFQVDATAERSWSKTVFLFNLSGLMPTLIEIAIGQERSLTALQTKMSDPMLWFTAYSFAGLGWAAIWACPRVIERLLAAYYRHCAETHRGKLKRIDDEWNVSAAHSGQN